MNRKYNALIKLKAQIGELKNYLPEKILDNIREIDNQILILELGEKLGIEIHEYHDPISGYVDLNPGMRSHTVSLIRFSDGDGKEIGWPDDGIIRPENGWYLRFSFSCGAYTFSSDYPAKSFDAFFQHLKSYGAHHCDTMNHTLHFSLEKEIERARNVYKDYEMLFARYQEEGRKEILNKKIAAAQKELDKLKGEM